MSVSIDSVQCGSCKQTLDESSSLLPEDRLPCPACGSMIRIHNVQMKDTITPRTKLGLKHKRPGFNKPIYEEVGGDDLYRKTGLWSRLLRVIDRQNNRYKEEITNAETGEVLRSVDEPLSDHRGRGSSKKRLPPE